MGEVWAAIITVVGGVVLAPWGLFVTGKLVPASRVTDVEREGAARTAEAESRAEKANKEAQTWRASHDSIKAAFDGQTKILERQQLTAEITDRLMSVVDERLASMGGATS